MSDLRWLKAAGWEEALREMRRRGRWIVGICGGYQMLGDEVADPLGVEGDTAVERGLGFLPVRTAMSPLKTTRRVEARWEVGACAGTFWGYELHMGRTIVGAAARPRFRVRAVEGVRWRRDGACDRAGRTWGTYVHGLFESGPFLQAWLSLVGGERDVAIRVGWRNWRGERDSRLDRLADVLERHLDMAAIRAATGLEESERRVSRRRIGKSGQTY